MYFDLNLVLFLNSLVLYLVYVYVPRLLVVSNWLFYGCLVVVWCSMANCSGVRILCYFLLGCFTRLVLGIAVFLGSRFRLLFSSWFWISG